MLPVTLMAITPAGSSGITIGPETPPAWMTCVTCSRRRSSCSLLRSDRSSRAWVVGAATGSSPIARCPTAASRCITTRPTKPLDPVTSVTAELIRSRLTWSWRVLGPLRRKHVEIQHRLVAQHLAPVRHASRDDHEAARAGLMLFVADIEHHPTLDDVGDLLVRMAVRPWLVPRRQAMQRDGRRRAGECLLLDALADLLPRNGAPVDLVDVLCWLLFGGAEHAGWADEQEQ